MTALRMEVAFGVEPIPPAAHQYSIPLSMYEFPMTGRVNPDDPLPVYAPLPFAPVELQFGNARRTSSFLLDTGAQQCILSTTTALDLGLDLNGNGDLWDEAKSFQEVSGVGGTTVIPVLQIDALALRAAGGSDLVFRDVAVGIIDIDDALPGVRADLIAGRNGGNWDGNAGITSALAAASGSTRAVGYTVAGDGSVRVSFAAPGDTNLDGLVDLIDLLAILGSGTYDRPLPAVWDQGDFNYDGVTDLLDLLAILGSGTYDEGPVMQTATVPPGTVAAVPEPSRLWPVLAAATAGTLFRRRGVSRRAGRR